MAAVQIVLPPAHLQIFQFPLFSYPIRLNTMPFGVFRANLSKTRLCVLQPLCATVLCDSMTLQIHSLTISETEDRIDFRTNRTAVFGAISHHFKRVKRQCAHHSFIFVQLPSLCVVSPVLESCCVSYSIMSSFSPHNIVSALKFWNHR